MATLLERVAKATKRRADAELEFRAALVAARPTHSWNELAAITGLSKNGVKYLVVEHTKGESNGSGGGAPSAEQPRGDTRARGRRRGASHSQESEA